MHRWSHGRLARLAGRGRPGAPPAIFPIAGSFARDDPSYPAPTPRLESTATEVLSTRSAIWKGCIFIPALSRNSFRLIIGEGNILHTGRGTPRFPPAGGFTGLPA